MDIKTIVAFSFAIINFLIGAISIIKNIVASVKARDWEKLKAEMRKEIIPLMEQAEKILKDPTEKENWVIKKLSDATHIDFYKYQNILSLAKTIIKEICETTKIEVNKSIVINEVEERMEGENYGTNGIS